MSLHVIKVQCSLCKYISIQHATCQMILTNGWIIGVPKHRNSVSYLYIKDGSANRSTKNRPWAWAGEVSCVSGPDGTPCGGKRTIALMGIFGRKVHLRQTLLPISVSVVSVVQTSAQISAADAVRCATSILRPRWSLLWPPVLLKAVHSFAHCC